MLKNILRFETIKSRIFTLLLLVFTSEGKTQLSAFFNPIKVYSIEFGNTLSEINEANQNELELIKDSNDTLFYRLPLQSMVTITFFTGIDWGSQDERLNTDLYLNFRKSNSIEQSKLINVSFHAVCDSKMKLFLIENFNRISYQKSSRIDSSKCKIRGYVSHSFDLMKTAFLIIGKDSSNPKEHCEFIGYDFNKSECDLKTLEMKETINASTEHRELRLGEGNGTFSATVKHIQNILLSGKTIKFLENSFQDWSETKYTYSIEYNKKAKRTERVEHSRNYELCTSDKSSQFSNCQKIRIFFDRNETVKSIYIEVSETSLLGDIIPQLQNAGYRLTKAEYNCFMFSGTLDLGNKKNILRASVAKHQDNDLGYYYFGIYKLEKNTSQKQ